MTFCELDNTEPNTKHPLKDTKPMCLCFYLAVWSDLCQDNRLGHLTVLLWQWRTHCVLMNFVMARYADTNREQGGQYDMIQYIIQLNHISNQNWYTKTFYKWCSSGLDSGSDHFLQELIKCRRDLSVHTRVIDVVLIIFLLDFLGFRWTSSSSS